MGVKALWAAGADSPAEKHRGYAFITFANPADAQDAIDNYDLNELPGYKGKYLKCSLAQPNRYNNEGKGDKFDRPGEGDALRFRLMTSFLTDPAVTYETDRSDIAVWESEEWLQKYAKTAEDGQGGPPAGPPNGDDDEV